jgi:tetratricopeptide (TPR) repeat protein
MWSRHVLDTEAWSGEVARWDVDPGGAPAPRASYWFTRGLAAAHLGDRAAARRALTEFATAQREIVTSVAGGSEPPAPDDRQFLTRLEVLRLELVGVIEGALDTLRRAAALDDSMPYAFGPPFVNQPPHELLARQLVAAGLVDEGRREYERALVRAPRRTPALLAQARAASQAGDRAAAKRIHRELVTIWHAADPDLPGLAQARAGP